MASSPSVHDPTPEAIRLQTEKILESDLFREAPVQKKLLTYLADQFLTGAAGNLKESVLGVAVFQRGEDFDPRVDSIVRVQIGVLRKKLAAYYAGPGSRDTLLVEVPRGHYCPHFSPLTPPPEAELAPEVGQTLPVSSGQAARRPWIYLAMGLVAGCLLAFVALSLTRSTKATAAESAPTGPEWGTTWQDLSLGNVVYLSTFAHGPVSPGLGLQGDFEFDAKTGALRNLRPAQGEAREFKPGGGIDYALVSIRRSPAEGRRVATIVGAHDWGTQTAAEYMTGANGLAEVRTKLSPAPSAGSALQIVLEIRLRDAQPAGAAMVAHHWISGGAQPR